MVSKGLQSILIFSQELSYDLSESAFKMCSRCHDCLRKGMSTTIL